MRERLVRLIITCLFVYIATSDLEEVLTSLKSLASRLKRGPARGSMESQSQQEPTPYTFDTTGSRSSVGGGGSGGGGIGGEMYNSDGTKVRTSTKTIAGAGQPTTITTDSSSSSNEDDGGGQNGFLETLRQKFNSMQRGMKEDSSAAKGHGTLGNELSTDTDFEREQLTKLKAKWTEIMQEHCLPKLVCELHATVADSYSLTDAEKGLLTVIKETSLGTASAIVSRYHFAAHMGQLLYGVEGNGCYNLYPKCPISGSKVIQMVKRVRVK